MRNAIRISDRAENRAAVRAVIDTEPFVSEILA
jgi:hypothetical protein